MSRSSIRNQLKLTDGLGNPVNVATTTWVTQWINVDEHRRVSFTIGIQGSTGATPDYGGYTGTLLVQGTNELGQNNGATGTQECGNTNRPGINGFTGARFYATIPSGSIAVNNQFGSPGNAVLLTFENVGPSYIRLAFNQSPTGPLTNFANCGSGLWNIYLTAKNA